MNTIEEKVFTVTCDALFVAAKICEALELIRYDPAGATSDDLELVKEIRGLLTQAMERANTIRSSVGKN